MPQFGVDAAPSPPRPSAVKSARFSDTDPRDRAAYTAAEAATLLGVPASTLHKWIKGRPYPTKQGTRTSAPIIRTPEPNFLSFTNLVEAHVLASFRRERIALDKIRSAVRYIERDLGVEHPLARQEFKTDKIDLFVERLEGLLNASRDGQYAMKEIIEEHLHDVEYDRGRAMRLFKRHREDAPRVVVIDPRRAFGRPVLVGTSVPIAAIASRFAHGDAPEELARDYEVSTDTILEVLRATTQQKAAA